LGDHPSPFFACVGSSEALPQRLKPGINGHFIAALKCCAAQKLDAALKRRSTVVLQGGECGPLKPTEGLSGPPGRDFVSRPGGLGLLFHVSRLPPLQITQGRGTLSLDFASEIKSLSHPPRGPKIQLPLEEIRKKGLVQTLRQRTRRK